MKRILEIPACKVTQHLDRFSLELSKDNKMLSQDILKFCIEKWGGYVSFKISPPRRPRKIGKGSQSAHFNGHCQQIAVELGMNFEMVKSYMKSQAIGRGYPILQDESGTPVQDLYGNTLGISEADCTVEECKFLIDEIHQFADEHSIVLMEGN